MEESPGKQFLLLPAPSRDPMVSYDPHTRKMEALAYLLLEKTRVVAVVVVVVGKENSRESDKSPNLKRWLSTALAVFFQLETE